MSLSFSFCIRTVCCNRDIEILSTLLRLQNDFTEELKKSNENRVRYFNMQKLSNEGTSTRMKNDF